jgi:FKBP-type peptidyl-prolyl cis-trans isomerase SlyD
MAHSKKIISFNYTLKNTQGEVLDSSSDGPLAFLEGAGQIIPKLEEAILKMTPGQKETVNLSAEEAYGMPDEKMKMSVPRQEMAHLTIEVGGFLKLELADQDKIVRIAEITEEYVTIDGNHPLAGQALIFNIELVSSRAATEEEIEHGHAHGPDGHDHH